MSAQVVVVQRSRPRAFSTLRAIPAWLRSLTTPRASALPSPASERGPTPSFVDWAPPLEGSGTASPWLLWSEGGEHGCVGCGRCEAVCPGAALRVELEEAAGDAIEIRRFELEPGRCMGCGLCRRACPEEALIMAEGGSRVGVGAAPARLGLVDLLRRAA